jgi:hypothetical protein
MVLRVRSVGRASRLAGKYATVPEVVELISTGAGVILYQHCDRSSWHVQRERVRAQLVAGTTEPLAFRSLRFGAFGGRAFFCVSTEQEITQTIDAALQALRRRTAHWDRAHHLLFE